MGSINANSPAETGAPIEDIESVVAVDIGLCVGSNVTVRGRRTGSLFGGSGMGVSSASKFHETPFSGIVIFCVASII